MAIITATEYKAHAGITASTWDSLITTKIASAQKLVERFTGNIYSTTSATDEAYDGNESAILQLRNFPSSTTAITIRQDDGTETDLATTDWREDPTTGRLYRLGAEDGRFVSDGFEDNWTEAPQWITSPNWPRGFKNILVTYSYGYAIADADLKEAMYGLVDLMFLPVQNGAPDPTMQSEKLGDYQYTRRDNAEGKDPIQQYLIQRFTIFRRGDLF